MTLSEAVKSGDNLEIYKVQRRITAERLETSDLDDDTFSRLSATLLNVQKEIVKLEGEQNKDDDFEDYVDDLEAIRKGSRIDG